MGNDTKIIKGTNIPVMIKVFKGKTELIKKNIYLPEGKYKTIYYDKHYNKIK